jgi:prepilin-type N-terminal cleavage/methylation domain-containing protein
MKQSNKGFTLIEILVVIGIIAILAAIVIVSINPAKRFQDARNSQRKANVESILNAVQQDMVDHKGITTCTIGTVAKNISSIVGETNLATCLAPYLAVLPVDPQNGVWTDNANYNTHYTIMMDGTTKQVTITATDAPADGGGTITATR